MSRVGFSGSGYRAYFAICRPSKVARKQGILQVFLLLFMASGFLEFWTLGRDSAWALNLNCNQAPTCGRLQLQCRVFWFSGNLQIQVRPHPKSPNPTPQP